jgi:tetratricopeptide (TPR) repeat protein
MAGLLNREADLMELNGKTDEARKKHEEAIKHLRITLRIRPAMENGRVSLGNALLAIGKIDEAIEEFEKIVTNNPRHALAQSNLANAYADKGDLDKAIKHYEYALGADPTRPDAHYNLARILRAKGYVDEALSEYRKALELYPGDLTAYWSCMGAGGILTSRGQNAQALEYFKKAVEINERSRVDSRQNAAANELRRLQAPGRKP